MKGAAANTSKKKYGYMRSSELAQKGQWLLITKDLLDCRERFAPVTPALVQRAAAAGVDLDHQMTKTKKELRKEVRRRQKELWECQKNGESLRAEWLRPCAIQIGRKSSTRWPGQPKTDQLIGNCPRL